VTKTLRQIDTEKIKGKKSYRIREQEEKEAEEEIKQFKVPPCVGHAFEEEVDDNPEV
jgi:hypothetical protein